MQFILKLVAVFIVCTVLHASTTHYSPTLRHYFLKQELQGAYQGLWPAAKRGSTDALDALTKLAVVNQDEYWLEQAASLNNVDAMVALAALSNTDDKLSWWVKAANLGHAPSQFELSLVEKDTATRIRYLEQAALNEFAPAIIALGKYYYDNSDIDKALRWLDKASTLDARSQFKLAKMQWRQGLTEKSLNSFSQAALNSNDANTYYQVIKNTPLQSLIELSTMESKDGLDESCSQQLQFVATTLESVVQATNFKQRFENDQRLSGLPICVNSIVWLKPDELSCQLENDRKRCDLSDLATKKFEPNFTHLVLFLDSGKAYVHNGVMHLDESDVYSVFVHELAHFAGFVDEYAVSADLAQAYCYRGGAPNLAIATQDTLEQNEDYQRWQTYNREINRIEQDRASVQRENALRSMPNAAIQNTQIDFNPILLRVDGSRTCAKLDINTFKPSDKLTFMEFHDANTIPEIYKYMWKVQLNQNHHELAVATWLKQSALAAGALDASDYWASF